MFVVTGHRQRWPAPLVLWPERAALGRFIHFSTGALVHSCAVVDQRVYANHPHIYPQNVTLADRQGRRDRSMLSCWPWFPLRAGQSSPPCLDRNADHAQDVRGAPRDSSLAQVAQLSLRVCTTVGLSRGRCPATPGPASETELTPHRGVVKPQGKVRSEHPLNTACSITVQQPGRTRRSRATTTAAANSAMTFSDRSR